jgi:flagella basal body P-ring formation protein FlgA
MIAVPIRLLRAACVCVPLMANAAAPSQVTISLRPAVHVSSPQVRLGEVADLSAPDLASLRRLMDIPLGPAPRAGSVEMFERADIERAAKAIAGDVVAKAFWSGAARVEVQGETNILDGRQIVRAAQASLRDALAMHAGHVELFAPSVPHDLDLPAGNVVLRPRVASDEIVGRRTVVWVDVYAADRLARSVPVTFEVVVSGWNRHVESKSPLADDVRVPAPAPVSVAKVSADAAVRAGIQGRVREEKARKAACCAQTASAASGAASVHEERAVVRGTWATLHLQSGAVVLENRVQVLEDGRKGEFVRVVTPGAGTPFVAQVSGVNQVEVRE